MLRSAKALVSRIFTFFTVYWRTLYPMAGAPPDSLACMNIRVTPQSFQPAGPAPALQPTRRRFNPSADILDEVVAGLLWMTLDLPPDVSRRELESFRASIGGADQIRRQRLRHVESEIVSCNPISLAVRPITMPFTLWPDAS